MTKHFTRNTVSVAAWCSKCQKSTQHRVDGVKLGPCLACIAGLDELHEQQKEIAREQWHQGGLFQ